MQKKLGLNIDHVATLREARKTIYPDPVYAAVIAEIAGVDGITAHLREDRRHIRDRDIYLLKQIIKTSLNLEMSLNDEIIKIALDIKPDEICIVPENRLEITTEGGLDVDKNKQKLKEIIPEFNKIGTKVSIFVDPDRKQIELSKELSSTYIELNTGRYSEAKTENEIYSELQKLKEATLLATSIGLRVNAGHGLNYKNVKGLEKAIKEMLYLIK